MLGINKLLAFLRRQVGLRTDAASATGSLHAKIAEELARIGAINPPSGGTDTLFKFLKQLETVLMAKGNQPRITVASTTSTTLSNVLSVSGSGYLVGIFQRVSWSATSYSGSLELTFDGTIGLSDSGFASTQRAGAEVTHNWQAVVTADLAFFHRFNSSLLVRHKSSAAYSVTTWVAYVLD